MADNFTPVQTQKTTLSGSGVTSTATTIVLKSLKLPDGTTNIAMSDFGDIGFATLEPGTTREEQISFTGITQNGSGTADLTGVTRGLRFVAPYDEVSANKFAHSGGAVVVFSNTGGFYNEFVGKDNDETITGTHTYSTTPKITNAPVDGEDAGNKDYIDATATGTTNVNRIVVAGDAGETVAAGDILYRKDSDGEWYKSDASTAATSENVQIGIAQGAGTDGAAISGGVLIKGTDSNQSSLTANTKYFLSDTAGALSTTAGTVEVEVGYAHPTDATKFILDPKFDKFITEDQQDALAGTSGTPSASNKYITNDDTTGTGDVVRQSVVDAVNTDIFGNGNDGNVTISSGTTTLTRDMYYADLTIETGGVLDANGFRVFVSGTLDCQGTGKIAVNGGTGSNGANGSGGGNGGGGGTGGTAPYSTGTLPIPIDGENGGSGGSNNSNGTVGVIGTDQAKALGDINAVAGGVGGDSVGGGGTVGGAGGAGGSKTGTVVSQPQSPISAYNLYDLEAGTLTQHNVAPSGGGGGGGAGYNTNEGGGGGGGGAGSAAGCVFIAAKTITTLNAEAIGGNGGQGGNGGEASKGGVGGGGAGGNGGAIILLYKTSTTINTDVSGGTGGAIGSSGEQTNATAGTNGSSGTVYTITIS